MPVLSIGKCTYGEVNILFDSEDTVVEIGSYCSIAGGVVVYGACHHRTSSVSSFPFHEIFEWPEYPRNAYSKGGLKIDNDVWIGNDVHIVSGISIGTGAVIGARSMVTRDVPPYAIVAGSPAVVKSYRFSPHVIDALLSSRWWDLEPEQLRPLCKLLVSSAEEDILAFAREVRLLLCASSKHTMYDHVHLVLYSPTSEYKRMYDLTRTYYATFKHIKTLYYTFSETIDEDYVVIGDILLIKGIETYIPGILDKTVKAFEYAEKNISFSGYIVRSNVSTIVDFAKLFVDGFLPSFDYGGPVQVLSWTSPEDGIVDSSFEGLTYISGTCILMSKHFLMHLLHHKSCVNYSLIDDVSVGVFFKEACTGMMLYPIGFVKNGDAHFKEVFGSDVKKDDKVLFYRNKSHDRTMDIHHMSIILDMLMNT